MAESVVSEGSVISNNNQININSENDLHKRVVAWIRRFNPQLIAIPGLGELQTTDSSRLEAWYKGYVKGTCDIMILNNHKVFRGMCIELKTPKGSGKLTEFQDQFLQRMRANKFMVLISNQYDEIIYEIQKYSSKIIKAGTKRGRKRKTATIA
jgi:hypothetical protein